MRKVSLNTQARLRGISAGPFWPLLSSRAANSTGTASTSRPDRPASPWTWVQARYA